MAKSKRSKVKLAYKAMRRQILQKNTDKKVRKIAARTYKQLDIALPPERTEEQRMPSRTHNGMVLVSTFMPTAPQPILNIVHGPLANDMKEVVDYEAECKVKTVEDKEAEMDTETDERLEYVKRPYFYPRRKLRNDKNKLQQLRQRPTRHPQNNPAIQF